MVLNGTFTMFTDLSNMLNIPDTDLHTDKLDSRLHLVSIQKDNADHTPTACKALMLQKKQTNTGNVSLQKNIININI